VSPDPAGPDSRSPVPVSILKSPRTGVDALQDARNGKMTFAGVALMATRGDGANRTVGAFL